MQYRLEVVSVENLMDIEELHGYMPVDNLSETEAWLKARENEAMSLVSVLWSTGKDTSFGCAEILGIGIGTIMTETIVS